MSIAYRPVSGLKPYARNPRRNDAAVKKMVASIVEYGFSVPILAQSDGTVIDGHLRLKAAVELKMIEVPVIACDGWTQAQVKAFRLLANRSVAWAEWDEKLLALEFDELRQEGFDLSLTGFGDAEMARIMSGLVQAEDDAPEPPVDPITKPGDLWMLGKHRLLCGDATKAEDVARVLNGAKPQVMVTDPPYGVDYDPAWRNDALQEGYGAAPKGRAIGVVTNDDRLDWSRAYAHHAGNVAYIWHAGRHASEVQRSIESCGFSVRAQIIWAKNNIAISRGHYHWQHEPCWYAVRTGSGANWTGDRKQTTLWQIDKPMKSETGHSTQKPVECMRRPILNHTVTGDAVYDPFLGSGTTLIAAETTGRACFGLEINPAYCDVVASRWETISGERADRK